MHIIHSDLIELLADYEIILQSNIFIRHLDSRCDAITNPIGRKIPIRIDPKQSVPVKCRIINFSSALSSDNLSDNLSDEYFNAVNEIKNLLGDQITNVKMDDLLEIPISETTGNYCLPVKRNQLLLGPYPISGGSEIKIPDKEGDFFNTKFIQGCVSIQVKAHL